MKKTFLLSVSIFCVTFLPAQNPGDLNTDFGINGIAFEEWSDSITRIYDIGIQSDGHVIVPGQLHSPSGYDVLVSSLDGQGEICTFGNCTRGYVHGFIDVETAKAIKILPDDRILVAGFYEQLAPEAFVIRLLANGEIDEEFADNGVLDLGDRWMEVNDLDIYGDAESYKILLAGKSGSDNPMLVMLNQDGTLETAFGTGGIITDLAHPGEITDIVVDNGSDAVYIAVAYSGFTTALSKIDATNGDFVTAFGTGGVVSSASLPIEITFNAIALDAENDVLAAFGQYRHAAGDLDMCALRVSATDGSIDTDFGVDGWAWLRSAATDEYLTAAIQQDDNKYYIGGYSNFNGNNDFLVGRMTDDGLADITFGTGGLVLLPLIADQYLGGLALSPDEHIVYAAGFSYTTDDATLTLAAFHTTEATRTDAELSGNEVSIFPNPAKDKITIYTGKTGTHKLVITDLNGRKVMRRNWSDGTYELNLEGLSPSVYILSLELPGNQMVNSRIIKQ